VVIALVTASEARDHDKDLLPVYEALIARGVEVEIHNWDNVAVNWKQFAAAIVRSPWDYHRRCSEFVQWLDEVSQLTQLYNRAEVVKWNLDKTYLSQMQDAGIPIIPTHFVHSMDQMQQPVDELQTFLVGDVVVKPTVSAGSNHTERFRNDYDSAAAFIEQLLHMGKVAMVQPYQKAIDDSAETALCYVNDEFSHAFRKGPILSSGVNVKNGLFVVEDISDREASSAQLDVGTLVMNFLIQRWGEVPLYARVDLVPDVNGNPIVIEVEMAEPSFFFHTTPGSAERFADAIVTLVA
jgi:glutathione synthase/RimK-type ligase-like ATP-grasp enzyme